MCITSASVGAVDCTKRPGPCVTIGGLVTESGTAPRATSQVLRLLRALGAAVRLASHRAATSAARDAGAPTDLDELVELVSAAVAPATERSSSSAPSALSAAGAPATARPITPQAASVLPVPSIPDDLQRVSERVLRDAKARMDIAFNAVTLRPGDPGYTYDRRIEFQAPRQASEWDD